MKSTSPGLWIVTIAGILAMVALPVSSVSAEEPEPARTQAEAENGEKTTTSAKESATPATDEAELALSSRAPSNAPITVSSGKAKKPRSLADLASGIDLNTPKGEGSESIVISNDNLKTMGKGAVVSEGSNMGGPVTDSDWYVPSSRGQAASEDDIEAARREVERLETQAGLYNQAVEDNNTMNLYTGSGPQYRAPGQTNPLEDRQEDSNKELADARARLAAMEKGASRGARSGAASGSPSPQESPDSGGGE